MPWYKCIVNEVGPASDGTETPAPVIYINLTDTAGAFTNTWFYAANGIQDQVLNTGIAAILGGQYVEVGAVAPNTQNQPTEIQRIYALWTPEQKPSSGLIGNSNYVYANAGNPLTNISVTVVITEDIDLLNDSGGDLSHNKAKTGYGFQLNCLSPASSSDKTFWQQYIVTVTNNTLNAVINNWKPGFSSTGSLDKEIDLIDTYPGTQLTRLSGYTLPKGYRLTISLDSSNEGGTNPENNVVSVTFSGQDENGVAFGLPPQQLTDQKNQQTGQNVQTADLSPVYLIGFYLVGPDNGEAATLSSGSGWITLKSSGMTVYPGGDLAVGVAIFPASIGVPDWGTEEDSNAVYSEVPTGSHATFVQTFNVP